MRVVIPSVRYADFLAVTLPAWRRFLPRAKFIVVTAPEDAETQRIARAHRTRCLATDAWTRPLPRTHPEAGPRPPKFNKALALDEAFGFVEGGTPPGIGERCLALDADVMPFGQFPYDWRPKRHTLYGCARYECASAEALAAHQRGLTRREDLRLIAPRAPGRDRNLLQDHPRAAAWIARRCLGYFQLFRYREGLRFGSYRSAGKYDLVFRYQFEGRGVVDSLYVLHLGEQRRDNWTGRVVAPWRAA